MTGRRYTLTADAIWTPSGLRRGLAVDLDGARILDVRSVRRGDPPPYHGILIPGLVNAHTHVEFGGPAVGGGTGFVDWVGDLMSHPYARNAHGSSVAQLVAAGTAWVVDVGQSSAEAAKAMRTAGLAGVCHQEVMGFDERELPTQRHLARRFRSMGCGGVWQRATPHALFSTAPPLVHDLVRFGLGPPATIHVGESEDEVDFLMSGLGPHADLLDRLGRRWRWWSPAGCRPIELLDRMGLLGRQLLLVHGVQFHAADLRRAAVAGAPLVACARSNLHIGGRLPALDRWWALGGDLALGTDGRVSTRDLDVLAELPVLSRVFPTIPVAWWLAAVTHMGARVTGAPAHLGRIEVGCAPGLVLLEELDSLESLGEEVPSRRWLVKPGRWS